MRLLVIVCVLNDYAEIGEKCRAKWSEKGQLDQILEVLIIVPFIVGKPYTKNGSIAIT